MPSRDCCPDRGAPPSQPSRCGPAGEVAPGQGDRPRFPGIEEVEGRLVYDVMLERLAPARGDYESDPDNADNIIWYGRRTAYAGDYRGAIEIFSEGIEKFPADARMKEILVDAAAIAEATARSVTYYPRYPGTYAWRDTEGTWVVPFADHDSSWIEGGARKIECQLYYHYNCIVVTPAMAAAPGPGKGSEYVFASLDSEKRILEGSKSYQMTLPANVPVADFWAITLYDTQTRSQLQTDQQFPTLDTYTKGLRANEDGSYTIYFGPEAPAGKESNWLQTIAGKSFFVCLRMYGPTEPWIEGSWRPGDVELVG